MQRPHLPEIFPVTSHTQYVGAGSTYVAIQGAQTHGLDFVAQALLQGATTIVVAQSDNVPARIEQLIEEYGARLVRVENPREQLAILSAQAAGFPADRLKIVGITGTKGKTTTAFIARHMLESAGYKVALLSTVKNSIDGHDFPAALTTAQPDYLHQFFKVACDYGVTHVVMEVAAQALVLHRVDTLLFDAAIMTNLSLEHLEFFDSMESYFKAKCKLFDFRKPGAFLFYNGDDAWCKTISVPLAISYGQQAPANVVFTVTKDAAHLMLGQKSVLLASPKLYGVYNCYNMVAAALAVYFLGVAPEILAECLQSLPAIPGRLQMHQLPNGACGIIDYAHNPDSFYHVLSTLRTRTENLIVVFGAGGKRDKSRRPLMGAVAAQYCDEIVLTADNPRDENVADIIRDIRMGIPVESACTVHEIYDRQKAIEKAYALSKSGSIIAILGKGPDEYQIIGSLKTFFSDRLVLEQLL